MTIHVEGPGSSLPTRNLRLSISISAAKQSWKAIMFCWTTHDCESYATNWTSCRSRNCSCIVVSIGLTVLSERWFGSGGGTSSGPPDNLLGNISHTVHDTTGFREIAVLRPFRANDQTIESSSRRRCQSPLRILDHDALFTIMHKKTFEGTPALPNFLGSPQLLKEVKANFSCNPRTFFRSAGGLFQHL